MRAPSSPTQAHCRQCGYSLRGLSAAGICPECGSAFDLALRKTWTRHPRARRAWRAVRWPVRLLLLLVLAAGASLGWVYWEWRQERRAIAWMAEGEAEVRLVGPDWLKDRAGRWAWMLERTEVLYLHAEDSPQTRELRRLRWLKELDIGEKGAAGDWVADLVAANQLEQLFLHSPAIGDEFLTRLGRQEKLDTLTIWNWNRASPVTDAGLQALSGFPQLRKLGLWQCQLEGPGLQQLRHVPKLEHLGLGRTRVGDDAMPAVGRCVELKHLSLSGTRITSRGIQHLAGLQNLEELELDDTEVDDEAVRTIASLASLRVVRLKRSAVSNAGCEMLRRALPAADVQWAPRRR